MKIENEIILVENNIYDLEEKSVDYFYNLFVTGDKNEERKDIKRDI